MNTAKLYDQLFDTLAIFSSNLSPDGNKKIQEKILSVCDAKTNEAAIRVLTELGSIVGDEASRQQMPLLFETFETVISQKIGELASSSPQDSPLDEEIRNAEELLLRARESLAKFEHSACPGYDKNEVFLAMKCSVSDTEKTLELLKKKKEELAAYTSSSSVEKVGIGLLECAGLENVSNKCYAHGCLKGLWASKKFREIIDRKAKEIEEYLAKKPEGPRPKLTALYLSRLFLTFDATTPSEVIKAEEKAIKDLLREMAKYHPTLASGRQEDSTEFLYWIFEDIFKSTEQLFSYVEQKKRPEGLVGDFVMPTIDRVNPISGNMFVISFPQEENAEVDVQASFEAQFVEENVEPDKIVTSEYNAEKDPAKIIEALSHFPKTIILPQTIVFQKLPPCLFIHLWRQSKDVSVPLERLKDELRSEPTLKELNLSEDELLAMAREEQPRRAQLKKKIPSVATFPQVLTIHSSIPHRETVRCVLKGVIVHEGIYTTEGHYYTYLPPDTTNDETTPMKLAEASPSGIVEHKQSEIIFIDDADSKKEDISTAPQPAPAEPEPHLQEGKGSASLLQQAEESASGIVEQKQPEVIVIDDVDSKKEDIPTAPQPAPAEVKPQSQEGNGPAPSQAGSPRFPSPPRPSSVVCHNDSRVRKVAYDEVLEKELKDRGYVLIYDIEEDPSAAK